MREATPAGSNTRVYQTPPARFQILALDGGGIRGLYTASLLAALERDLDTRLLDHFDLIAGTSTGGIIALGLVLGKTPAELVDFYVSEGPHIFRHPRGFRAWLRHLTRAKHGAEELERCLRLAFGDRKLAEAARAVVVPTYNLDTDAPIVLKTPHHPDFRADQHIPAWQAALATSAAPTYLPASAHIRGNRHVDGGLWANNPALVAAIEAHRYLGVPLDRIRVFSIGTGSVVSERPASLTRGGRWAWRDDGVDVLLRAQGEGAHNEVRLLVGKERVLRVNPKVPPSWKPLDVLRDEFAGRAAEDAKEHGPAFAREFMPHQGLDLETLRAVAGGGGAEESHVRIGTQ